VVLAVPHSPQYCSIDLTSNFSRSRVNVSGINQYNQIIPQLALFRHIWRTKKRSSEKHNSPVK
jgi:hypothetical protein